MGVYDEYGSKAIQLKVGPCELHHYNIGDKVPIPDGIYAGYEGIVAIAKGVVCAEFDHLMDKWGGCIPPENIIASRNPLASIIKGFVPKGDIDFCPTCGTALGYKEDEQ